MVNTSLCPCSSELPYAECCKSFHLGEAIPETAELLMRSRYAAYVKKLKNYLLETWHESTRPKPEELELNEESGFRWLSLKITSTENGSALDTEGKVCFSAHFKMGHQKGQMDEASSFVRENGRWYYVDGV